MAEHGSPALNTQIESGHFDEKERPTEAAPTKVKAEDPEDEDEDIDALIEDLESQDGHADEDEEDEERDATGGRTIPDELLQTVSRPPPPFRAKQTDLICLCLATLANARTERMWPRYNHEPNVSNAMLTTPPCRTPVLVSLRPRLSPAARSMVSTR